MTTPNTNPGLADLGNGMMAPTGAPMTFQPSSLLLPPDTSPTTEQIQQTSFYGTSAWDPDNGLRVFEANGEHVFAAAGFDPAQLPVGAVEVPSGVGGLPATSNNAPLPSGSAPSTTNAPTPSATPFTVTTETASTGAAAAAETNDPHATPHQSALTWFEGEAKKLGGEGEAVAKAAIAKLRELFAAAKAKL